MDIDIMNSKFNGYIASLKKTIEVAHGCKPWHSKTVFVFEVSGGKNVFKGDVEIFSLVGHPEAKKCYAWSYECEMGVTRFATMLQLPPVRSAKDAVRIFTISRA